MDVLFIIIVVSTVVVSIASAIDKAKSSKSAKNVLDAIHEQNAGGDTARPVYARPQYRLNRTAPQIGIAQPTPASHGTPDSRNRAAPDNGDFTGSMRPYGPQEGASAPEPPEYARGTGGRPMSTRHDPVIPETRNRRNPWASALNTRAAIRNAVVMSEILGRPKALRGHGARAAR